MFKHHHISPEEIERLKAEGISPGQHTAEQVHEDELDELQFGDRHFGGQAHTHVDRHGKLYAAKFDELGREIDEDGNLMTVMDIIERRLHHSQFEGREPPEGLFKRWDIENKEPPILYYQEKHWEGLEPPWAEEERELAIFMNAECEVTELREAYHAACYRHGHLIPCTTVCMMAFHRYYDRLIEPKCLKGTIHHTPTSEHLRWLLLAHDAEIAHHCPDKYRVMDVREMHALHMMIDKSQPDNPELGLDDTAHAGHLHMQKKPTSAERKGIDADLPGHGFNVKLDVL
ncbi:hypothetical protein CAOG_009667 [Capsaspora owczarzaki ATCC 30864]|uniref:Uncharacterized protein n=1 Tax=Capsaspora owczarzaki (strain ATCC 30864) TaxID=595528 RepID=A0A0D2WPD1_CAPO3|nr:hypothetical protein CAOG_009667 [Capsaspora owczarzaki ATCC 30864]